MMRHDELGDHFRTADSLSLPSFCATTAILRTRTSTFPSKNCDKYAFLYLSVDVMTLCNVLFCVSIEPMHERWPLVVGRWNP